jgi:chromate transporter
MNPFLLYLLLLKATLTSFSGMTSLPMLRNDLVVKRQVLSDRQLNTAVAAGRMGPGPAGLYVVSVGYFAGGLPGAVAGWLAMVTPAFLIVPLLAYAGRKAENSRVRSMIQAVTVTAAGLVLSICLPLARDAITGALPMAITAVSFLILNFTKVETLWVILGSAFAGLLGFLV